MPAEPTEIPPREIRAIGPRADAESLRVSYLDLLKLALCDLAGATTRTVTWTGDGRVFSREPEGEEQRGWRAGGRDWPLNALTMVGLRRLDDLQRCVESVVADGVEGDLVEAGAWRGGSSILMRATLDSLGAHDRSVWVADSFQGFPAPETGGDPADVELEQQMNSALDYLSAPLDTVKEHFARFGCSEGVRFVPGFFEDTMPRLHDGHWAVIRLDGDSYKATRLTLDALYPNLAVGGYVVLDDYCFLPASQRAVDDFRAERGITEPIERIDWNGARWRRESDAPIPLPESAVPSASAARTPAERSGDPIPTARELELGDEVEALRARLAAVEAELEQERSSPAGPLRWARRRAGRRA